MLKPLVALALSSLAVPALAGECESNFKKSGNPLVMTTYSSAVTVPNLTTRDALAQMRGILVAEKMDVMAEDADGGTLLVEQRQSKGARPIPTTISVSMRPVRVSLRPLWRALTAIAFLSASRAIIRENR